MYLQAFSLYFKTSKNKDNGTKLKGRVQNKSRQIQESNQHNEMYS